MLQSQENPGRQPCVVPLPIQPATDQDVLAGEGAPTAAPSTPTAGGTPVLPLDLPDYNDQWMLLL